MSERFVLDASLAVSWCLEEENTKAVEAVLDSFIHGGNALIPSLWVWEVNNVLLMAERSKKLDPAKRHQQIALLKKLPIDIDEDAHGQAWSQTTHLAQAHALTVYDAAYLELSMRHGLPLGSLDKNLRSAAKKVGIKCLPAHI